MLSLPWVLFLPWVFILLHQLRKSHGRCRANTSRNIVAHFKHYTFLLGPRDRSIKSLPIITKRKFAFYDYVGIL